MYSIYLRGLFPFVLLGSGSPKKEKEKWKEGKKKCFVRLTFACFRCQYGLDGREVGVCVWTLEDRNIIAKIDSWDIVGCTRKFD